MFIPFTPWATSQFGQQSYQSWLPFCVQPVHSFFYKCYRSIALQSQKDRHMLLIFSRCHICCHWHAPVTSMCWQAFSCIKEPGIRWAGTERWDREMRRRLKPVAAKRKGWRCVTTSDPDRDREKYQESCQHDLKLNRETPIRTVSRRPKVEIQNNGV